MHIDYNYVCQSLAHLTGLEVRLYADGSLATHYRQRVFEPDTAKLVETRIAEHDGTAFYLETDEMLIFGVIRSKNNDGVTVVLGPTAHILPGSSEAVGVIYQLGEAYSRLPELQSYFSNMVSYPLENFLGILCHLNYIINGEKLSAADLILADAPYKDATESSPRDEHSINAAEPAAHNTYAMENRMLSFVSSGNMQAIEEFIQDPTVGRIGALAQHELRQRKNAFIVAVTLICRAAIEGGLPAQSAFALSDRYIQRAELLSTVSELSLLNVEMLTDYTQRVSDCKYGTGDTPFARTVVQYIMQNLAQKITTADIAEALGINRQHLCERFKEETGLTIVECITNAKLDEAKRLLATTTLSAAQISEYLAFSTQSYFQTVFKKATGCTPKEYRRKCNEDA